MLNNFVKVSLKDSSLGSINKSQETRRSFVLSYPCSNSHSCTPYVLEIAKGLYKFECWGSRGGQWTNVERHLISTPGLGAYTSGILYVPKPTTFYVYIGNIGMFNAAKTTKTSFNSLSQALPGGATDIRLNYSIDWWDYYSLISRIMVAAGGGGAEWWKSIGGNGGGLEGGESISAKSDFFAEIFDERCQGGKQTTGSDCKSLDGRSAFKGTFGSAGIYEASITENGDEDYGGFGGGGYYGGTSYQFAYAGSGGSSYISGNEGCKAVLEHTETIDHTNTSYHYSGLVFTNTEMKRGNETMPLPTSLSSPGIHQDKGAFRLTLLLYHFNCTYKRSIYYSLIPNIVT